MEKSNRILEEVTVPLVEQVGDGRPSILRFFLDVLETLLLSLLLFLSVNVVSARIRVDGYSMEPTLHDGEFILVSKLSYLLGEPQRGDIVVFHYPGNPKQDYIKRVIGLPGDDISIAHGTVQVNSMVLSEDYIAAPPHYEGVWTVPADTLFVLGDNRNNSSDSHSWGPLPMDYIVGRAVFIYWPLQSWGMIDHSAIAVAAP
ncbi:MAG: signal peptidase I [Chloroflexota bacterium]